MHACPERSLAARCGRSSLPVMERIACLNTWLRESIECASWRGSTLLLSGRPLSSNTSAARWHTFVKHRKVALIGSSTMRAMVADQNLDKPLSSFLHAEQSTVPADGGTVWLPNNTWKVTTHGCNETTGSGCPTANVHAVGKPIAQAEVPTSPGETLRCCRMVQGRVRAVRASCTSHGSQNTFRTQTRRHLRRVSASTLPMCFTSTRVCTMHALCTVAKVLMSWSRSLRTSCADLRSCYDACQVHRARLS